MKKKFTLKKEISIVFLTICLLLFNLILHAQIPNVKFNYVANSNGDWSSSGTWQGNQAPPGDTIKNVNIKINAGVTVRLDKSIIIDGVDSSKTKQFLINGKIEGAGKSLKMSNMHVFGLGKAKPHIKVDTILFGMGTNYNYNGLLTCKDLINRGGRVVIDSGKIWISRKLILLKGVVIVRDTANFRLKDSVLVHLNGGRLINRSGTPLIAKLKRMRFEQRMDSLKAFADSIEYVEIDLPAENDSIILSDNLIIDSLELKKGTLKLNDKKLVILGQFIPGDGKIAGSKKAMLHIKGSGAPVMLSFAPGKRYLKKLHIAREVSLDDSLTVTDTLAIEKGGVLELKKGLMKIDGKLISAKGLIRGSQKAIMEFTKGELLDTLIFEAKKDSLQELRLENAGSKLPLGSDLIIEKKFVNMGTVILGAHKLIINKEYNAPKGKIAGHKKASLELKGDGEIDTLRFEASKEKLKTLKIDRSMKKPIIIASKLEIDSLIDLKNGKVKIQMGELHIARKAMIKNFDANNYIIVTKKAKLVQKMDGNNKPVLFPVGTDSAYTPAEITQTSGKDTNEYRLAMSDTVFANGNSGAKIQHTRTVKKTWFIETDGASITIKVKIVWNISSEDAGFNRKKCFISHFVNNKWDMVTATEAVKEGDNYVLMREGINSLSPFTVMSEEESSIETPVVEKLNVYPVPAQDIINIQTGLTGYDLSIINAVGGIVHAQKINSAETIINLDNLPRGLYFINYMGKTKKFVKN